MRTRILVVAGLLVVAAALHGQQPQQPQQPQPSQPQPSAQPSQPAQQPQGQKAPAQEPPIVVYRIDLVPNGSVFAMNEPVLQGDTYVFRSLPERSEERLAKSKVKGIAKRTNDWESEVVWQIEGVSDKTLLVRDEPVKKGRNYVFTTWKTGALLSLPETEVRKVNRLTGFTAWKAEMKELGVVVLEGETTQAGFKQTKDAPAPGSPQGQAPQGGQGNWIYQGVPGASDAYAPGNATVARPGDTPMAPQPTQVPR